MTKGISALPSIAIVKSRELEPETFIPYTRHVDERIIALDSRAMMVINRHEPGDPAEGPGADFATRPARLTTR